MSDRDFETELFALYGEPSQAWADEGVTDRVVRRIERETLLRGALSGLAVLAGGAAAAGAVAAFAGQLIADAVVRTGAAPAMMWLAVLSGAALLGAAAIRITLET